MKATTLRNAIALTATAALLAWGCDEETSQGQPTAATADATIPSAPDAGGEIDAPRPDVVIEPLPPPPPAPDPEFGEILREALDNADLEHTVDAWLRQAHVLAGERPVLLRDHSVSQQLEAVLELIDALPSHGLDVTDIGSEDIAGLRHLALHLREVDGFSGDEPVDRLHAKELAAGEAVLARVWLRLAEVMGAARPQPPRTRNDARLRLLEALASWEDPRALVRTLPPTTPQYDKLRQALAFYRELHRQGGFHEVPESVRKAKPRKKHPDIPALRERLRQEDPEVALGSDLWDDELTAALRRAREAFQLKQQRRKRNLINKGLLRALAVTAAERVANLELNLERHRASQLRDYDYAVFVNLPDYHAEVWDGPELALSTKIVVGSPRRRGGRFVNATPVVTARIQRIIYNPYWNVPPRILHGELLPQAQKKVDKALREAAESPPPEGQVPPPPGPATPSDYLRSKGFEIMNEDDPGKMWVRKVPGPGNALGKVKFLFENRWYVFLHDTNEKAKFRYPRRAFSHGCVRVQKPLELAELLLRRDGTWRIAERKRVMRHYREIHIPLETSVPIVIDYVTAKVADSGRVYWLHDVYDRDRKRIANR